jgi:hypothetical protein
MTTNTVMQQGSFTSTGAAVTLQIRSGIDWMRVYNTTQMAASQTTALGVEYYWQGGFPQGAMIEYKKAGSANAGANLVVYSTSGGFTYVNSSLPISQTINATVTAVSNLTIPVVSNSGTNGLTAGSIVRMINVTSALEIGGMDFTVGYNTLSTGTFSLDYMSQIVAGTTGSCMYVPYDALYYPRRRFITNISQATQAVVTLSVTHGYQVGQLIRMVVPVAFGMTQMNGLQATIVAINTTVTSGNTITLNINSSAFTAFAFPLSAAVPFTFAQTVPMGEDTADALSQGVDILTDATINTGYIGMILAAGANSPAGSNADVVYWQAGTVFNGLSQ